MNLESSLSATASLADSPFRDVIKRVMEASLEAASPKAALNRFLKRDADRLSVDTSSYDLRKFSHIYLIGAGKAALPMMEAVTLALGDRITAGVIITKEGHLAGQHELITQSYKNTLEVFEAGHPVPDQRGVQAALRIVKVLKEVGEDDLVLCLLSGGGSALLTAPETGISLEDLQELTGKLLASGANIVEINTLRKHLDRVKGGRLARLAAPATMVTLVLSDVVGDLLQSIASGPTVPDNSTFAQAWQVLEKYQLADQIPKSIADHLISGCKGEIPETPKPGDQAFRKIQTVIVGSNNLSARAAQSQARQEGLNPLLLTTFLQGESAHVGRVLAGITRQVAHYGEPIHRPACLIAGGETTVTIHGDGWGGRNQEVALGTVEELAGLNDVVLVTLATDGGDGPTDAAGAVVTGETYARAAQIGLNISDFLTRNDSYHFFEPLGDLIKTGPTQTNVNDLVLIFVF